MTRNQLARIRYNRSLFIVHAEFIQSKKGKVSHVALSNVMKKYYGWSHEKTRRYIDAFLSCAEKDGLVYNVRKRSFCLT